MDWQFGSLLNSIFLPAKRKKGMALCLLILSFRKEGGKKKISNTACCIGIGGKKLIYTYTIQGMLA